MGFFEHVLRGTNYATAKPGTPIDFLSFHAKGRPEFVVGARANLCRCGERCARALQHAGHWWLPIADDGQRHGCECHKLMA